MTLTQKIERLFRSPKLCDDCLAKLFSNDRAYVHTVTTGMNRKEQDAFEKKQELCHGCGRSKFVIRASAQLIKAV